MTTIDQIKQQCRAILAQAEKATPGPWERVSVFYIVGPDRKGLADVSEGRQCALERCRNGDFIASSSSFTPRGARALLTTIQMFELMHAQSAIDTICREWEASK